MTRLLIRVALFALAIMFALPLIDGIQFHGNFVEAIGLGAAFTLLTWFVARVAAWVSGFLAVLTLGIGLLIIVPMWLFGFWALPGIALKLMADMLPAYLTVASWKAALLGGLVMFFINLFTVERKKTVVIVRRNGSK